MHFPNIPLYTAHDLSSYKMLQRQSESAYFTTSGPFILIGRAVISYVHTFITTISY